MNKYNYYLGIDLHKKFSQVCVINNQAEVLENQKLENTDEVLFPFFLKYQNQGQAVVEAIGFNGWLIDILEQKFNIPVTIAHPFKVKAIASAKIKTDKIDAHTLADLLRVNLIPSVYRPIRKDRDLKDLIRFRFKLVKYQTSLKNSIHTVLRVERIDHPYSDLFGTKGSAFLKQLELKPEKKEVLDTYLNLLEQIQVKTKELYQRITDLAKQDNRAARLVSIPGIGYLTALAIVSEIGDINRFPSASRLCSYAGLIPSLHASGGSSYYGRITKTGSRILRWALVECAHRTIHSSTCSSNLRDWFNNLSKRGGKKKATVALARKLLTLCYYLWKGKEKYLTNYPKAGKAVVRTGN